VIADNALRKLVFTGLTFEDGGVGQSGANNVWLAPGFVGSSTNFETTLRLAPVASIGSPLSSVSTSWFARRPIITSNAAWYVRGTSIERCAFDTSFFFDPTCTLVAFVGSNDPIASVKTAGGFVTNPGGVLSELPENGRISQPYGSAPTDQLVLDVPRSPTGARACGTGLGIAYISDGSSGVTAYLVDAQGLDGTAYWPQARHDNANSGNLNRSLAPWSCP